MWVKFEWIEIMWKRCDCFFMSVMTKLLELPRLLISWKNSAQQKFVNHRCVNCLYRVIRMIKRLSSCTAELTMNCSSTFNCKWILCTFSAESFSLSLIHKNILLLLNYCKTQDFAVTIVLETKCLSQHWRAPSDCRNLICWQRMNISHTRSHLNNFLENKKIKVAYVVCKATIESQISKTVTMVCIS